jgi:hypothetical protein
LENVGLGIYTLISKWGFPKTYRDKIMLVVFLGTHAPLLGAALYLLLGSAVGLGPALRILALLVGSPSSGPLQRCWPWARCSPR